MVLYGASGHAKVILDILSAMGITVSELMDDDSSIDNLHGIRVARPHEVSEEVIISIGSNAIRKRIVAANRFKYGIAIHPSAIVSPTAKIGDGSVIMQGAIIQADAVIGKHCIVNTGATVGHECVVSDYSHIAPNSSLCGNVHVGEGTWIGAGTTVIPGVKIGSWSIVGAGSTVIRDIDSNVTAVGCPCKIIRKSLSTNKLVGGDVEAYKRCKIFKTEYYAA